MPQWLGTGSSSPQEGYRYCRIICRSYLIYIPHLLVILRHRLSKMVFLPWQKDDAHYNITASYSVAITSTLGTLDCSSLYQNTQPKARNALVRNVFPATDGHVWKCNGITLLRASNISSQTHICMLLLHIVGLGLFPLHGTRHGIWYTGCRTISSIWTRTSHITK